MTDKDFDKLNESMHTIIYKNESMHDIPYKNKGIIFYKFEKNKLFIFMYKNNDEKYEDIKINNININLVPLYKLYIDNSNIIYFIDIDKYSDIYDNIIKQNNKKLIKISLEMFNTSSIHKYAKINKLQNREIEIILNKIKINYILHGKLKNNL